MGSNLTFADAISPCLNILKIFALTLDLLTVGITVGSNSNRWRTTMTILSKLNLTDMTRSKMIASPEARLRHKILEALEDQIAAAKAD